MQESNLPELGCYQPPSLPAHPTLRGADDRKQPETGRPLETHTAR